MTRGTLATVCLEDDDPRRLDTAVSVARTLDLHLEAICVEPANLYISPMMPPDTLSIATILEDGRKALTELESRVSARLAREEVAHDVGGIDPASTAFAPDLARRLRFADLALMPRATGASADLARLFEAVLYASGVPILLADRDPGAAPRVVLAWDDSDVALAAVRAALPILATAGAVEIVAVDPPHRTFGHALAVMLSRHGIETTVTALPKGEGRVAETLSEHARATEADLIVAGAYGHARLRQAILGGVTRDLLRTDGPALLLAR